MSDTENKAAPVEVPAEATEKQAETTAQEQTEAPATDVSAEKTAETATEEAKPSEEKTAEEAGESESKKEAPKILKTTAQINRDDYKKNVKSDPTTLQISDDPKAIRKQVEYYFSDSNLPTDKFMWEQTGGEANKPVPLKTICSFKRMSRFRPYTAIVNALKESTEIELVGGEESGKEMVQRKTPYSPSSERKQKAMASSVYVKGFGDEWPQAQFELEAWFNQFGTVNNVKLRRTPERLFKGSVFVEFENEETADKFMKTNPKWKSEYDLKIMKKKDYCEEKNQLIRDGKLEPSQSAPPFRGDVRGGGNARGGRGGKPGSENRKPRWDNDRKNDRNGGGRGRGRGGGGRFRGRGGRGGFNGNRDQKTEEKKEEKSTNGSTIPKIQSSAPPASSEKMEGVKDAGENGNGKRAREETGAAGEPPAKKVNVEAAAAEAS